MSPGHGIRTHQEQEISTLRYGSIVIPVDSQTVEQRMRVIELPLPYSQFTTKLLWEGGLSDH